MDKKKGAVWGSKILEAARLRKPFSLSPFFFNENQLL
jgi:hypothetical protein